MSRSETKQKEFECTIFQQQHSERGLMLSNVVTIPFSAFCFQHQICGLFHFQNAN